MLDPRAIAVAVFVVSVVLALCLLGFARSTRQPVAVRYWAAGVAMSGAALLVNAAQGDLPASIAFGLGAPGMIVGVGWVWMGVRRISGRPALHLLYGVPAAVMAAVAWRWGVVTQNDLIRVVWFSVLMAGVMLGMAWQLWGWRKGPMKAGTYYLGGAVVMLAVLFLGRLVGLMLTDALPVQRLGPVNSVSYLVGGAMYMGIGTGLLLLTQLVLVRELAHTAEHDSLTGLLNRRGLRAAVGDHVADATVLSLDVDYFKQLNDTHGHAAGDAVLQWLGSALGEFVRQGDQAARLGGEEFAVFLHGQDLRDGLAVAERLRAKISRESGPATGHPITVSIGVAQSTAGERCDHLLARADSGMYQAKALGRNRCEAAPPDAPLPAPERTGARQGVQA